MLTLASALREMFGVQLYKNKCALLWRILSILNLDWLQHARSVRRVYESHMNCWDLKYVSAFVYKVSIVNDFTGGLLCIE